ncbi:MAG: hypothetical protein R3F20_14780 [Planctomycetota bacterium]
MLRVLPLVLFLGALASAQATDTGTRLEYVFTLKPAANAPGAHEIALRLEGLPAGPFEVAIPAWKPGSYRLLDSHQRIEMRGAKSASGADLAVERQGDLRWRVTGDHGGAATVTYGGRTARASETWASLEGPETWLYLVGRTTAPCRARFVLPKDWQVASGLTEGKDERGLWHAAPDYDTFADCPVELGMLTIDRFEVDGVPYEITYNEAPVFDRADMIEMCRRIVRVQIAIFGGAAWKEYSFMWHLQRRGSGGGGLEHLNSTTLQVPQFVMRGDVETMADLVAHEFFHAWNVKRIRPFELGPFDYSGPVRVKSLWFCEGVTDYYAARTCMDAGIWDRARFLKNMEGEWTRLRNDRSYMKESIEDSSWKIWDRNYYNPDGLDYYNVGKVLGMLLDVEIRASSKGKHSLDDVMRDLMKRFGLPEPGFRDADLREAASRAAGRDLGPFFDACVSGREDFPIEATLAKIGVAVTGELRPTKDRIALRALHADVEVVTKENEDGKRFLVEKAPEGDPFRAGDEILEIGDRAPREPRGRGAFVSWNLNSAARSVREAGETVPVRIRRGGEEMTLEIPIPFREVWSGSFVEMAEVSPEVAALRETWLKARAGREDGKR